MNLPALQTARLLGGAKRVEGTHGCEVWRGVVRLASKVDLAVHVKVGSKAQLFSEFFAAQAALQLALPGPTPFRVLCEASQLPGLTHWPWRETSAGVIFGCGSIEGADAFARFCRFDNRRQQTLLLKWKHYWLAVWFDELLLNQDRHLGNVLAVSVDDYWLIDHDDAFGGAAWVALGLMPADTPSNNQLLLHTRPAREPKHDAAGMDALRTHGIKIANLNLDALAPLDILPQHQRAEALGFIRERITHLPDLACLQLQPPQISLPLGSTSSQSAPP